ncbi:sporulation protein YabP [Alteribacillus persepolensis]|uniref:Sporulation protein YabP n=1 Tax=Alteribacillus persepolensis TaxID=568899 RepID=A0A1G8I0B2_9BACI|nr:sporulation protein YabP [Alteribacillus persepolensis]SDI12277.1 sporulation protein YabP [Alteribacillus persepolensis]
MSFHEGTMPERVNSPHEVILKGRKSLDITGVKEVESFDNEEFLLETTLGFLSVRGHNLHIKNLDVHEGIISIEGKVDDLVYVDQTTGSKSKGLLGKLFK